MQIWHILYLNAADVITSYKKCLLSKLVQHKNMKPTAIYSRWRWQPIAVAVVAAVAVVEVVAIVAVPEPRKSKKTLKDLCHS